MATANWRYRTCPDCDHIDAASNFTFLGPFGANWNNEGQADRECPNCGVQAPTKYFRPPSPSRLMIEFGPGCATCNARPDGAFSNGSPHYPATCLHDPIFPATVIEFPVAATTDKADAA